MIINQGMEWTEAADIKKDLEHILKTIEMQHIDLDRVHCYRTTGAQTRAYARTWSFPKIFQKALGVQAAYVIEVVAKRYDKLSDDEKKKTLIHELLHIPKNFSGALVPHRTKTRNIYTLTNQLFKEYKNKINL